MPASFENVVIKFKGDARQFLSTMDKMKMRSKQVVRDIKASFTKLALSIAGVGLALYPVVNTFKDFEFQMQKVKALSGANADEFKKLKNQAKELGATTMRSASQAAEAMEALALAGFKVNEIYGLVPSVLNMSIAGSLSMGEAAEKVSEIMKSYELPIEDAARAIDILVKSQAIATQSLDESAAAGRKGAIGFQRFGDSVETVIGFTSALANLGIRGEEAGTAMRNVYNYAAQNAEKLKEQGIHVFNTQGEFVGMLEVLKQVENALEGLTEEQQQEIFSLLGMQRAQQTWAQLLRVGSDEIENMISKLNESSGATDEYVSILEDSLEGTILELKSAIEGLTIAIGEGLKPTLESIIEPVIKFVRHITEWINQNEELTATIIKWTARIGGAIAAIAALRIAVMALRFVFGGLLGWIGLAVQAIIFLAQRFNFGWEQISRIVNNIVNAIRRAYNAVAGFLGIQKRETIRWQYSYGDANRTEPSNLYTAPLSDIQGGGAVEISDGSLAQSGGAASLNNHIKVDLNLDGEKIAGAMIEQFNKQGVIVNTE